MTDTLLRSLREHLLDESEPLAGLLRKCLLLGAETGSESLREWARRELYGYGEEDEVPTYRKFHDVPMSVDSTSGRFWRQGDTISRLHLPLEARKYVPEELTFRQPIEELQHLAGQKKLNFTAPGLAVAQAIWSRELGPFQNIDGLSYVMSGSVVVGILGQIRTKLVDVVADLTAETPMSELPKKGQVDAAVSHRLGDIYNTTIQTATGPVAIGAKATASMEGLTVEDALRLLDKVQVAAADIAEAQRAELLDALTELRAAVESDEPETGDVVKKVGKLRVIADKLGVASVAAATGGAAQAITELAVSGAFG
ncbi:hypothetical protein [Micromonospora sp. NPDC049645]|uniref:AbiTii domain-containing protein n=1 Tax=Micromonospora sp. NPDC049645 TaxID=3155508 RepID=UPI00341F0A53